MGYNITDLMMAVKAWNPPTPGGQHTLLYRDHPAICDIKRYSPLYGSLEVPRAQN
jgi:hypothetical protein